MFRDENHDDGQVDQFVGFVSLHRTVNIVTCFHTHSFVVFHTLKNNTIVTCMLTARDHILSNMQDRVLQIMQLIQFCHVFRFLVTITNNFIGNNVGITKWSLAGYKAMGFDVTPLTQDTNKNLFSFGTEYPIPVAFYLTVTHGPNMVKLSSHQQYLWRKERKLCSIPLFGNPSNNFFALI